MDILYKESLKSKISNNINSAIENERNRYMTIPNYSSVAEGFDKRAIAINTIVYETDLCNKHKDYLSKRNYAISILDSMELTL